MLWCPWLQVLKRQHWLRDHWSASMDLFLTSLVLLTAILTSSNTFFNFVTFYVFAPMPASSPRLEIHEGRHAVSFAHYCAPSIYLEKHRLLSK